jgi:hypothetical protein
MTEPFFGHAETTSSPSGGGAVLEGIRQEDIVVQPVGDSGWRVRDRRISDLDARSLLGYIEKKGRRFELMQLDPGFAWFFYDSLAEAAAHFTRERTR